jgi:hypothetical protein
VAHFVPSWGTFCAVLWHIMCRPVAHFVPSCGTFCAFLWHRSLKVFLCRAMAHFVPSCGTFCAFPWHISLKVFLCRSMAHFVPSRGTFCAFPWYILCLPVAHSILFPLVKNCKSRIASQELQVKNCNKKYFSRFGHFFLAA